MMYKSQDEWMDEEQIIFFMCVGGGGGYGKSILFWGCTSGGVHAACIYTQARWELP